jgi:hypothetical protein
MQFTKELHFTPASDWQTVTLVAREFVTDAGARLSGWREVQMLELDSKGGTGEEPKFGTFRWIQPE